MGLSDEYARKRMKCYTKRDYLGFLVHEFSTTPFLTLDQKVSLIEAIQSLAVLEDEMTTYRLRCLKGEDPGPAPPAVFDPSLSSFAGGIRYAVGCALGADWLDSRMMSGGRTAEETARRMEKELSEQEAELREAPIHELKGFADAKDEMAESYVKAGWDRLYPEYAPIIEWYREEGRRLRAMRTEEMAKRRAKSRGGAKRREPQDKGRRGK